MPLVSRLHLLPSSAPRLALTFAGMIFLAVLTVVSEIRTKQLNISTRKAAIARNTIADSNARNAEVLKSMGFSSRAVDRFNEANGEHLELQTKSNDISGTFAAVSRVLRMLLQSALLGLGAYLTIKNELSAGAIIACSVASGRALAPVDLAIGNWKPFVGARIAYYRLRETVIALAAAEEPMKLPAPHLRLSVDKVTVANSGLRTGGSERVPQFRTGARSSAWDHRFECWRKNHVGFGRSQGFWPVLRGNVLAFERCWLPT